MLKAGNKILFAAALSFRVVKSKISASILSKAELLASFRVHSMSRQD